MATEEALSEGGSLGDGGLYCIQEIIWQTVRFAGGLSAAVLMLAEDFYLSTLPGAEAYTAILLRELLFFEKLFLLFAFIRFILLVLTLI